MGIVILVGGAISITLGLMLRAVSASPLQQSTSVTVVSAPPSEVTWVSDSFWDPASDWRQPTFDESGWLPSYPVVTQTSWSAPIPAADFIWGGVPGAGPDANGRYNIAPNPAPQFLFLRKNFCIYINADVNSVTAGNFLLQVAATAGTGDIYYNDVHVANLIYDDGRGETGFVYSWTPDPTLITAGRRAGRNTLAMRVRDDVTGGDTHAGVAFSFPFNYNIDNTAITLNSNPPSGSAVPGDPVTFNPNYASLSGDTPYTFNWDFGDGTTGPNPHPYAVAGTYTVTLVMADRFGCTSWPVTMQYVVADPTPVPTITPTFTLTPTIAPPPTPTNTPRPASTSAPPAPSQPTATPFIPTPTLIVPLLPETGDQGGVLFTSLTFVVGSVLLIAFCLRRYLVCRD
jgi:hypothetical protein